MFESKPIIPPVTGWLEVKLSQEVVLYLKDRIDHSVRENKSLKGTLAGNISTSLNVIDKDDYFMDNVLLGCANEYLKQFPFSFRKPDTNCDRSKLHLNSFWVNFQKKHEFNPIHDHSGVFSFVVWMKIPTKSSEQHSLPFLEGMSGPSASNFEMSYLDTLGSIRNYQYKMDPEVEGTMLFFPSSFKHAVYPFYESDEERISISGNLFYG